MNFSARKKRNIIIALAASVMISLCLFCLALSSSFVKAEAFTDLSGTPYNSVQLDGTKDYKINLNDADRKVTEGNTSNFDKDVYSYEGIAIEYGVVSGALGTSNIRPSQLIGISQASLIYNVKASAGTTFTYLGLSITGRVDHYKPGDAEFYEQHGTGSATECNNCYMKVYVSKTADFTNAPCKEYPASLGGGFIARDMNLAEINSEIGGMEECYVRIELSGARDWVTIEQMVFSADDPNPLNSVSLGSDGTKEISFAVGDSNKDNWGEITEIYMSSGLNYSNVAADHVGLASAGVDGYVVYKLESSEVGKSFDTLSVSCFGRVFHYAHDYMCSSNCRMEIWVSDNPLFTAGSKTTMVHKEYAGDDGNSSARTYDISEYVQAMEPERDSGEKHVVYVKILLNGVGDWVSLEKLTFVGTEKYTGYDSVAIDIENATSNIVFDKDDTVAFKNFTISNAVSTDPVITKSVVGPDGEDVEVSGDNFLIDKLGTYTVTYTVNDEGRIYSASYSVFSVEDSTASGLNTDNWYTERKDKEDDYEFVYRDTTVFNTATNYAIGDNTEFINTEEDLKNSKVVLKASDGNVGKKASAALLLPIPNKTKIVVPLDITKFEEGFRFVIAFTSKPGIPDFSTMSDNGMYFVLTKAGSKLIINGFFTGKDKDGKDVIGGAMGAGDRSFDGGNLAICLYKQLLTDENGSRDIINVYWNGTQTCYSANGYQPSSIYDANGNLYVSFCNESALEENVQIGSVYEGSTGVPTLSWAEDYYDDDGDLIEDKSQHGYVFNSELQRMFGTVYVNDEFRLPNLEFFDNKDGVLDLSLVVTDPNGDKVEIKTGTETVNEETIEYQYVVVEYAGYYKLTYSAINYGASETVDERTFKTVYRDGAYEMNFTDDLLPYGRVGRAVYLPNPDISVVMGDFNEEPSKDYTVEVKITTPSGVIEYAKPGSFYPTFEKGYYSILYSVTSYELVDDTDPENTNEPIVTRMYFSIQVKDDVDESNSYVDALDPENWVSYNMTTLAGLVGETVRPAEKDDLVNSALSDEAHVEKTENGLLLFEAAYCKLPFKLYDENDEDHNGLELSIDISRLRDKDEKDAWVCFGFSAKPGPGSFSHVMTPGSVYIMFYYQNNEYWYTAMYVRADGTFSGLFTYSLGTQNVLTFGIDKITDSASKTDNLNFYFNHTVTSAGTEVQMPYSELVDNEGFVYLNYWGQGAGDNPRTFKAVEIKSISVCDQSAPEFEFEGGEAALPKTFTKGETVKLPTITVSDNLDTEFKYQIALVAPDGKIIDHTKEFVVDQDGTYYLVLKATDNAGNYTNKHVSFEVVSGGCGSAFSADTLLPVAVILSVASLACVVRSIKKKYDK